MPNETVIEPKSEAEPSTAAQKDQTANLRVHLTNFCAVGLGASFFLPWARFFGGNISGFDLQKSGSGQLSLWLIPIMCVITVIAGVTKHSQKIVGQLTGALPFCVGVYWYCQLKNDLFQMLTYGAFLSLLFGAALFILPRNSK